MSTLSRGDQSINCKRVLTFMTLPTAYGHRLYWNRLISSFSHKEVSHGCSEVCEEGQQAPMRHVRRQAAEMPKYGHKALKLQANFVCRFNCYYFRKHLKVIRICGGKLPINLRAVYLRAIFTPSNA